MAAVAFKSNTPTFKCDGQQEKDPLRNTLLSYRLLKNSLHLFTSTYEDILTPTTCGMQNITNSNSMHECRGHSPQAARDFRGSGLDAPIQFQLPALSMKHIIIHNYSYSYNSFKNPHLLPHGPENQLRPHGSLDVYFCPNQPLVTKIGGAIVGLGMGQHTPANDRPKTQFWT